MLMRLALGKALPYIIAGIAGLGLFALVRKSGMDAYFRKVEAVVSREDADLRSAIREDDAWTQRQDDEYRKARRAISDTFEPSRGP